MTILVVASTKDRAGMNIADKLIKNYDFKETERKFEQMSVYRSQDVFLAYTNIDSIYASHLNESFSVDAIFFASKHKSESKKPTLTVHAPGNLTGQAIYGGSPRTLAFASPQRMKAALTSLYASTEKLGLDYSVSLEATHHGPTEISVPVTFVEIGSSIEQWVDDEAGEVVAKAIWEAAKKPVESVSAVGFGGGHYAKKQTEQVLEGDVAVGHLMPKYAMRDLNVETVKMMLAKTWGGCELAVLERKGMRGDDRRKLLEILDSLDVKIEQI